MATVTGTFDISTLLAARFQSPAAFGLETIELILRNDLSAHNAIVGEMLAEMCEVTSDRQRIYGTSVDGSMQEVDEYGAGPTQQNKPGATTGFPLRLFQFPLSWTAKFFQTAKAADMATMQLAAEKAHLREIQRQIKKAMFLSANYDFRDYLVDNVTLNVKRFVNADSAAIPDGPNGETFDGTSHTHYSANSGLTATVLTNLVNNVIEHGHGGYVKLAINKTDEAAVRALTGFVGYIDARVAASMNTDRASMTTLDVSRLDNRAIGVFAGAEVWVKPWALASYPFAWDSASPNKPLAFRQRDVDTLQGLRIAAENDEYPLIVKFMEAEFGIGVWTRTNGALLYTGGASWTDPTIA